MLSWGCPWDEQIHSGSMMSYSRTSVEIDVVVRCAFTSRGWGLKRMPFLLPWHYEGSPFYCICLLKYGRQVNEDESFGLGMNIPTYSDIEAKCGRVHALHQVVCVS